MVRLDNVRLVLTVAEEKRLEVHQVDGKTTFWNWNVREDIYMALPESDDGSKGIVF